MTDEVLAEVGASAPRRWMALGMVFLLGFMLVYIAMNSAPGFGFQIFLVVLGFGSIGIGVRMFNATKQKILLTREGLVSSTGETLVAIENIKRVNRGVFALKPSNGFTLVCKPVGDGARWMPGLWWRLSGRVGIGGVAPGNETKTMAQIIEALLVERGQLEV